ncbi:hypothetical protein FRB90_011829 [Tulasnella sp. 427]|nr:hypothetical protein FRB90_011829 [Tulasnella sp. 427]
MDGWVGFETPAILNIPEEITLEIFLWVISSTVSVKPLLPLRLVCRRWCQIVDSAPMLWTTINVADGLSAVQMAVQKSKDLLIDVIHRSSCKGPSVEVFLGKIQHTVGRWRSLDIRQHAIWEAATDSYPGLQTTAPAFLERLCLHTDLPLGTVRLFGGARAPSCLAVVSIRNTKVALSPLRLENVRYLDLQTSSEISLRDLFGILERSPSLVFLILKNLRFPSVERQSPTNPIHLNALEYMCLELSVSITNSIISSIRAPALSALELTCDLRGMSIWSCLFTPSTAHLIPSFSSMIEDAHGGLLGFKDNGNISFEVGYLILAMNTGKDVSELDQIAEELIEWFIGHGGTRITTIPFGLHFAGVDPSTEHAWFINDTLQVRRLGLWYLGGRLPPPTRLFTALQSPRASNWLFPELRTIDYDLSLYEEELFNPFLDVLEHRYGLLSDDTPGQADCLQTGANEAHLCPGALQEFRFYDGQYCPKRHGRRPINGNFLGRFGLIFPDEVWVNQILGGLDPSKQDRPSYEG